MNDINIKPIPKYIIKKIKNLDKNTYFSNIRFYCYLTTIKKQLMKITVACKNYEGQWFCKQVAIHKVNGNKCLVKDISYSIMGFYVNWYDENISKGTNGYDGRWVEAEPKYFDPNAPILNKKYALKFEKYKYSVADKYPYPDLLKYLEIYEEFPEVEYLIKMGLYHLATKKTLLKKLKKDKQFRKWISKNADILKNEYGNYPYFSTAIILYAYKYQISLFDALKEDRLIKEMRDDYTYKNCLKSLIKNSEIVARAFKELGVKAGDVVTICMENSYQAILAFLAANKIGAITTFLNYKESPHEIKKYLNLFESPVFINYNKDEAYNEDIKKDTKVKTIITLSEKDLYKKKFNEKDENKKYGYSDFITFNDLKTISEYKKGLINTLYGKNQDALLLYTSGSSGNPKTVLLTNENVIANGMYCKSTINLPQNKNERCLTFVPFKYPYGFATSVLLTFLCGRTVVVSPEGLTKENAASLLKDVNYYYGSPALIDTLIRTVPDGIDLSNGHTYECSGNHRWIIYITKTDYMIVHTVELQRGMMLRNFQTTEFIYVVDIKFTGEQDYVFCPVEPITHSCVLKYGEITGQCTGYAWGRFMEILGDTPKLSTANAGMWYGFTQDGYQRGQTPKLGAVACWSKPGAAGHVAIVEEIHDDGSITLGQSGYSSQNRFWTGQGSPPNYYHSPYVFQGFIYNPNAGTATGTFGMVGGDLYDELNDEDDAIMREVAYMTGHNPTTEQMMQTVRLSVINYTTALNSFFKGAIATPGTSGVVGEGVTFDTSILGPVPTQVIQSLTAHGTTVAGAIGVCANMYYESRFQPGVVEHGYTIATGGVGLCQWTNTPRGAATGRATNMMNFVGPNWRTDVSGQCEFLIHELTTIYTSVWAVLTTAPNSDAGAQQAADIFLRRFEVPANMEYNSRIRRAKASEFWSQIAPQLTA